MPYLLRRRRSGGSGDQHASQDASQKQSQGLTRATLSSQPERAATKGNDPLTTIGNTLKQLSLNREEQAAWYRIREQIGEKRRITKEIPELQLIQQELKELTSAVAKLTKPKAASWAQVAAPQVQPQYAPAQRKAHEILVTCPTNEEIGSTKTTAEVAREIRIQPGGGDIIQAARKLPSGAFALTFKSVEAKRAWHAGGSLATTFGPAAKVKEATLDVIAFGFPKGAISRLEDEERVKEITRNNPSLSGALCRVGILKSPSYKQTETIILGFNEPLGANKAIDQGVAWEANILRAEPYTSNVRTRRCFKCQSYTAHSAKYCRNQARCGWCAQIDHIADFCPSNKESDAKAYAPCGGTSGHCALDRSCPLRMREEERARAAYATRPSRFNPAGSPSDALARRDTLGPKVATPGNPIQTTVPPAQILPIFSDLTLSQTEEEGYTRVGSKHRRGRPYTVSTADTSGIPNIASFLRVPSTQFTSTPPSSGLVLESTEIVSREEAMTDTVPNDA
jgi:hypothetical protein